MSTSRNSNSNSNSTCCSYYD